MKTGLNMNDTVRVTAAERWLRMAKPSRALQELQRLPKSAWERTQIQLLVRRAVKAIALAERPPQVRLQIMSKPVTILVAEDDCNDVLPLKAAFAKVRGRVRVHFVRNGTEAIDYLQGVPPFNNRVKYPLPNLLLLDLKMPLMDGFEVLAWLRAHQSINPMTVVVLSGSYVQADFDCAHSLGANLCLKKPLYFRQLVSLVKDVIDRLQREGFEVLDLDAEAA